MSVESAFVKFQALATASLEDCASAARIYERTKDTINSGFELRYGTDEVSKRIAEHATNGGDMSNLFGSFNEMSAFLIDKCYYTEKSLEKVHGTLNQNIVDSINLYSDIPLKEIPEFGELTPIISALAFGSFIIVQKRREIKHYVKKLAQRLMHRQSGRGTGVLPS